MTLLFNRPALDKVRTNVRRVVALGSMAWVFRAVSLALTLTCLTSPETVSSLDRQPLTMAGKVLASRVVTPDSSTPSTREVPSSEGQEPYPSSSDAFFDEPDGPIRAGLLNEEIATIEKGRGGRSIAFRVTLKNGQKGYFKPEQSFSASNWFGEVAAYHLDRLLGLGRVPAVVSRVFPWKTFEPVAGNDPRKSEVTARDGKVVGAFVAWVTGGLRALPACVGWERWLRIERLSTTAVSPFQRPILWKRDMALAGRLGPAWRSEEARANLRNARPEPDRPDRPAELSDLVLFDYLTRNLDRWGGDNANVLTRGVGGPLVFLDNSAGFEPGAWQPDLGEARLHMLQRFRRSTVAAVRALNLRQFEARLASEVASPVLSKTQVNAVGARRTALLTWVASLEARHGEAIWAWE